MGLHQLAWPGGMWMAMAILIWLLAIGELAVGNVGEPNKVYLNQGGVLASTAAWVSAEADWTLKAWPGGMWMAMAILISLVGNSGLWLLCWRSQQGLSQPGRRLSQHSRLGFG